MAVVQTYTLDLTNHSNSVVVPVSQFDVGRQIKFNIKHNGAAYDVGSYSVIMQGRFQNGKGFTITGSTSGSTATVTCTAESTAFYGRVMAELRFAKGSETVGTMNFVWEVEEGPEYQTSITQDDLSIFQQLLTQSQSAAGNAQNYSNQAHTYAQQAQSIVASLKQRTYVMIGDSYGVGSNMSDSSKNWINVLKGYLSNDPNYVTSYTKAIAGSGFIGQKNSNNVPTFKEQIVSLAGTLTDAQKTSVTDVVVLGGWNDGKCDQTPASGASATELNDFGTAMSTFNSTTRSLFPNAKIWLGYISWCDPARYSNSSAWNAGVGAGEYAQYAGIFGWTYMANIQYAMHVYSSFSSDGLHPEEFGQRRIAKYAATALMGGSIDVRHGPDEVGWDMASGVTLSVWDPTNYPAMITTTLDNAVTTFWMRVGQFDFSTPFTIAHGDSYRTLLTLKTGQHCTVRGQVPSAASWRQPCIINHKVNGNTIWTRVDVEFRLDKNALTFAVLNMCSGNDASWHSFSSVSRLYVDGQILYSGVLPSRYT